MPQKVLSQIQLLCKEISKVEWSGVLFYSIEGSIKDPQNMVLTLEEIFLMDKGTKAYTEYSFDESVIEHMMENEHLEDCKIAHIHSHNSMDVFFSGTDMSELEDNAPNHNIYLSLIVNNYMDFIAKVCFVAETEESKVFDFIAKDETGVKYVYASESYNVTDRKLIIYDCEIETPHVALPVEDKFRSRLDAIIKKSERPVFTPPSKKIKAPYRLPSSRFRPSERTTFEMYADSYGLDIEDLMEEKEDDFNDLIDSIEDFSVLVMNTGKKLADTHNITQTIKNYKGFNLSGAALAKGVVENYVRTYETYYEGIEERDTASMFISITEQVIENLDDELISSTLPYMREMLLPSIQGLQNLLTRFKNNEKE